MGGLYDTATLHARTRFALAAVLSALGPVFVRAGVSSGSISSSSSSSSSNSISSFPHPLLYLGGRLESIALCEIITKPEMCKLAPDMAQLSVDCQRDRKSDYASRASL